MKYESRIEVIVLILQAAIEGATAIKIMYKISYLSYKHLIDCLNVLQKNGLIEYCMRNGVYVTTNKGMYFLHIYIELNELMALKSKRYSKRYTSTFHNLLLIHHLFNYAAISIQSLLILLRSAVEKLLA
jgi:predicted transcriptional regulator